MSEIDSKSDFSIVLRKMLCIHLQEQYVFCYEAVQQYLDSFSDYANFSEA